MMEQIDERSLDGCVEGMQGLQAGPPALTHSPVALPSEAQLQAYVAELETEQLQLQVCSSTCTGDSVILNLDKDSKSG